MRGEWHMHASQLLKTYLTLFILICILEIRLGSEDVLESIWRGSLISGSYCVGLFASIFIYRKFFHSLRHFPGPYWAGVSKFWHLYYSIESRNHLLLDSLHQKYGSFVRTGPSELTVFDPEIVRAIDFYGSPCTKPDWYDIMQPEVSIETTRSREEHDRRKRIWDHGFSIKAITEYEEKIVECAELLERGIATMARNHSPVNVGERFHWFSFDVMGYMAFGKPFGMLQDERYHSAIQKLRKAAALFGPFSPLPWLAQLAFGIAPWLGVIQDWYGFLEWCGEQMHERVQVIASL